MKIARCGILTALALTLSWPSPGRAAEDVREPAASQHGYVVLTEIVDGDEVARTSYLTAFDILDDRWLTRLLLRTPAGDHLVVSDRQFPLEGTDHLSLLHEETGWHAELEERSGITFDSVMEVGRPGMLAWRYAEEKPRSAALTAPGISSPFELASTTWDDDFFPTLFTVLSAQGEAAAMVRRMEPSTRRAITFLASLDRCASCSLPLLEMEYLVTILARAVEEEARPRPEPDGDLDLWRSVMGRPARTVSNLDAKARAFIEEFPSVSSSDPLADLRPPDGEAEAH